MRMPANSWCSPSRWARSAGRSSRPDPMPARLGSPGAVPADPRSPHGHPRPFRFGVQLANASSATGVGRPRPPGRGARVRQRCSMPDHFGDQLAPVPALMAAADATTDLKVGAARLRQRLQAPRRARQGGGHARPPLRGSGRVRHRRRVDEHRLRAVGHPARPGRRAHRPHGGGPRRVCKAIFAGEPSTSPGEHYTSPATTASPSRCSSRTRRSSSAAAASGS